MIEGLKKVSANNLVLNLNNDLSDEKNIIFESDDLADWLDRDFFPRVQLITDAKGYGGRAFSVYDDWIYVDDFKNVRSCTEKEIPNVVWDMISNHNPEEISKYLLNLKYGSLAYFTDEDVNQLPEDKFLYQAISNERKMKKLIDEFGVDDVIRLINNFCEIHFGIKTINSKVINMYSNPLTVYNFCGFNGSKLFYNPIEMLMFAIRTNINVDDLIKYKNDIDGNSNSTNN